MKWVLGRTFRDAYARTQRGARRYQDGGARAGRSSQVNERPKEGDRTSQRSTQEGSCRYREGTRQGGSSTRLTLGLDFSCQPQSGVEKRLGPAQQLPRRASRETFR
jgi:hypothetical protein